MKCIEEERKGREEEFLEKEMEVEIRVDGDNRLVVGGI